MAYTFFNTYSVNGKNIYGSTLSNYVVGIDVYIEQSNAADNYTSIKSIAWIRCNSGTSTSSTFYFKENNTTYQNTYIKLGANDTAGNSVKPGVNYYANEKITKYYHNSDGTKSVTLNFSVESDMKEGANANLNNYCFKSASISQSITLPAIYRLSSLSFSGDFTMSTAKTITISSYSSSFTHTVRYAFGSSSGTIASNAKTSCSWTPDRELGHQIPNSLSGVGTLYLDTYSGSTRIGTTSKQFTLWVSGDMYPTFTYDYYFNNVFNGVPITTQTTLTIKIQNAGGSRGSTIKSFSISGEGLNTTSSTGTTSVYTKSGTFTYTLKVTDSRGRTTTQTKSVYVYWYEKPVISATPKRCDQNGNPTDIGNYALVDLSYTIINPNNANVMSKHINILYKESTGNYKTFYDGNLTSYTSNNTRFFVSTIKFESSKSYDFKITITDSLNSTIIYVGMATASCIIDIEPLGFGVGKYHQRGALDINGDIYVNDMKFYECGTFTPSFYVGSGTSMTYLNRVGNYQRVGNYCMFDIYLQVENLTFSTDTHDLEINGLPYVNQGTYSAISIGYCSGIRFAGTNYILVGYVRTNDARISLSVMNLSTGKANPLRPTHGGIIDSTIEIIISGSYKLDL